MTAWPRWPPAWIGPGKKGAPQGTDATAGDPGQDPGGGRIGVARGADGVRLGASCGGDPPQQEGPGRGRGAASFPGAARCHRSAPSPCRRVGAGDRPPLEGDAELLGGAVRLLRHRRAAADEQRPGAALRVVPLPREAGERSEGGIAGDGGSWLGATDRRDGEPTACGRKCGVGAVGSGGVAVAARWAEPPTRGPDLGPSLPPRSSQLPAIT